MSLEALAKEEASGVSNDGAEPEKRRHRRVVREPRFAALSAFSTAMDFQPLAAPFDSGNQVPGSPQRNSQSGKLLIHLPPDELHIWSDKTSLGSPDPRPGSTEV